MMSLHECAVVISRHSSNQGDLALCSQADRTASSCPDWKKWRGLPENVFPLILQEQEEERHGLLTKHSMTVITVRI